MEKNLLEVKFKENPVDNTQKIPKEYFLKKIKIEQHPILHNNLNIFFNDSKNYFQTSYEDKYIIIGKKYNKISRRKYINPYDANFSVKKAKSKKTINRMSLKKPTILRSSNELTRRSKTLIEEKKKVFTTYEENSLKQGQRFIDDKEVDEIFNLFKKVRKINRNRYNNFITIKELNDKNNKNLFKFRRTSRNMTNNFLNIKNYNNKKITNSEKKKKPEIKKNDDNSISNKDLLNTKDASINEADYYKTSSTGFTGSFRDELNKKNSFLPTTTEYNESKHSNYKSKIFASKEIKDRYKLMLRQSQYLPIDIDKTITNKLANILSLQENTFLLNEKNRISQSKINKYISLKIKKAKNKHLLLENESYRSNLEIKKKLNNAQLKLHPEKIYDWYKDLHCSENYFLTHGRLPTVEIIRNPINMKKTDVHSKFLEKNEYLEKNLPKNIYNKMIKDFKNVEKNYEALCVTGINLLKFENDIFKKLKGRKIINDFERLMSPSKTKIRNIYSKIDRNIFTQNSKSSYKLSDSI